MIVSEYTLAVIGHQIFCEQYMLAASHTKNPPTPITRLFKTFCPVFAPKHRLSIRIIYGLYTTRGTTSVAAIAVFSSSI